MPKVTATSAYLNVPPRTLAEAERDRAARRFGLLARTHPPRLPASLSPEPSGKPLTKETAQKMLALHLYHAQKMGAMD